jgi:hypothetical protein
LSRPRIPLARRIAGLTGVSEEIIHGVLSENLSGAVYDECWQWRGTVVKHTTPVLNILKKITPVRRAIYAEMQGEPAPRSVRFRGVCPTWLCVHPAHAVEERVAFVDDEPAPEPATEATAEPGMTAEDLAEFIYAQDDLRDAEILAEISEQPIEFVRHVLDEMAAGHL